jgi:serine/threonine-protein kinase RsbW
MSEASPDTLDRSFPGELSQLPGLAAAVDAFLNRDGVPSETIDTVQLALDELAANVVHWSAGAGRSLEIRVQVSVQPAQVCLTIEDDGPAFDPCAVPSPDVGLPLAQRLEGGLGIHLVRSLVDGMTYARVGSRNVVEVRVARDHSLAVQETR